MPGVERPRGAGVPAAGPGALAPLGVDADDEVLYRVVLRTPGQTPQTLGQVVARPLRSVDAGIERLAGLGLVRTVDGTVVAEPPDRAIADLVQDQSSRLAAAQYRLAAARSSVPELLAEHRAGRQGEADSTVVSGLEVVAAADTVATFTRLLVETTGDIWHLRRDQWAVPGMEVADAALIQQLAGGRTSRALYPPAAMAPVHPSIRARAAAGEQVRVLVDVPSRLVVFGTEAAMIPERWGVSGGARLLVRQPGVVLALREVARTLWERAVVPSELGADRGAPTAAGARVAARPLLTLLADGAVDDQIARTLAVSVRTVRRRIAALLVELGADSRFQAGAEAVRRGWI